QLQVAIAARKIEGLDALPVLVDVLSACGEDRLIPAIAWQNLHALLPGQGERFVRLIGRIAGWQPGTAAPLAPALAKLLPRPRAGDRIRGEPGADLRPVGEILGHLVGHEPRLARECLAAIAGRLEEMSEARRAPLRDQLRPVLHPILEGDPTGPLWFDAQLL